MTALCRLVVVAPTRLYREGLARMLDDSGPLSVVGSAHGAPDGLVTVRALRPDVVLVDVVLMDALAAIVQAAAPGRVVALAVTRDEAQIIGCAEAGVCGYVEAEASVSELEHVLTSAVRNEAVCAPWVTTALLQRIGKLARERGADPAAAQRLTVREREVMALVTEGLSNKQIAARLRIELPTVKNHVHNVLDKLEVRGRFEAAARLNGRL